MKYRITDETFIIWLYVLSAMMLIGQFLAINILTSISFAVSFCILFIAWGLHLKECSLLDVLAMIIMLASLISAVLTCGDLTLDYFNNWMMFSSVFLYFSLCIKIKIGNLMVKKILKINLLVSIVCVIAYVCFQDKAFHVTNIGIKYLKFGFYNPNSLALFLLCLVFVVICGFSICYGRKYRLAKLIYVLVFSFFIVQTLSRTALFALLLFLGIYLLFKRKGQYYLPQSILFNLVIVIFPLIFVLGYMIFVDKISQSNLLTFFISEGKGIDSRQEVWRYAFSLFKESPIWGSYGNMMNASMFSQMHNSHLNVLVSYGIIVFLLVLSFLYVVLVNLCETSRKNRTELSAWAFIFCLVLGSGEAILFSGGLSFYLLVGALLLFCNSKENNEFF